MSLTHDDVRKLLEILNGSECEQFTLEEGDFKLYLRRRAPAADVVGEESRSTEVPARTMAQGVEGDAAPLSHVPRPTALPRAVPAGLAAVLAPMFGTFYRSPSPAAKPFVEPGTRVAPEDTVCLVEVMKLFNSVKAGMAGVVEQVLVDNGALVEHGQPLILVRPDTAATPAAS